MPPQFHQWQVPPSSKKARLAWLMDSWYERYCWWFRNPAFTSWYGSLSHYLQGFIHPWWCRISSINSISVRDGINVATDFGKYFCCTWYFGVGHRLNLGITPGSIKHIESPQNVWFIRMFRKSNLLKDTGPKNYNSLNQFHQPKKDCWHDRAAAFPLHIMKWPWVVVSENENCWGSFTGWSLVMLRSIRIPIFFGFTGWGYAPNV